MEEKRKKRKVEIKTTATTEIEMSSKYPRMLGGNAWIADPDLWVLFFAEYCKGVQT